MKLAKKMIDEKIGMGMDPNERGANLFQNLNYMLKFCLDETTYLCAYNVFCSEKLHRGIVARPQHVDDAAFNKNNQPLSWV